MAYNFKSIADVEVVVEPAESASVLIEENGVIKKAPKTAVGGGGAEMITVIINGNDYGDITAPNDLYNKIKEIFQTYALHSLNVCMFSPNDGENPSTIESMNIYQIYEYNDFYHIFLTGSYVFDVYSNGELNFYYDDD